MKKVILSKSPIQSIPARPSNPTPLELAINRFQREAVRVRQNLQQEPKPDGMALKKIKEDLAFLDRELIRISTQSSLQSNLSEYREGNKQKKSHELVREPHHPTKQLVSHLYAVAEPQPSKNHHPHHIVMGKGNARMMRTRLQMHLYGIGINDPVNGIWLPRSTAFEGHFTTPKAPPHSRIHSHNYQTWISDSLVNIRKSETQFVNKLRIIKLDIKNGTHPAKILEKKDINWSPSK